MCFIKFPLTWKDYKTKGHREQSHKSFPVQTSLFLSYLLPNSMSQGLFGEALNHRNNKKEENLTGKLRVLGMLSFTLFLPISNEDKHQIWWATSPPLNLFYLKQNSLEIVQQPSQTTHVQAMQGERRGGSSFSPPPKFRKFIQIKLAAGNLQGYLNFFLFKFRQNIVVDV